jgi:hypothetical protein
MEGQEIFCQGSCDGEGAKICVEVRSSVAKGSGGLAAFLSIFEEDSYASRWLKVVLTVPVGLGSSREYCEVVGEGEACVDSVGPSLSLVAMANSVVAGEAW